MKNNYLTFGRMLACKYETCIVSERSFTSEQRKKVIKNVYGQEREGGFTSNQRK